MRKLVLIFSLLGLIASAAAASDLYTHTTAEPERSFMVAATWWLPDYQSDTRDFAKRADGNGKVAGDIDNTCANYNKSWQTTVGADMECDAVKPLPNLTCYKNCRCKNVVSVGTGEQCNHYCLGSQCVSKSCKAGVSVGSGETCTEKCASNSNICTAKRCAATVSVGTGETCTTTCGGNCVAKSCKAGVSVATGETCTERCASNSGICTAKSCNATVSVGTGEQCNTSCGGNCVAKSCKGSVSVGTGEQCTQRCASNSGVCTAKSCKSTATVNTGEYCTERCVADNSCTAKACKGAVSVGVGETCNERCAANTNTCTAKKCNSAVGVNSSTEVCTQTCASDASVCTAKRAKTCAERSMKDCNGSCIANSECCGGCPTGQTCSNGSCVDDMDACEKYLRSICTAANKCAVNSTYFGAAVNKIIFYKKYLNLEDIMIGIDANGVTFESGETYKHIEACKNAPMAMAAGTLNTNFRGTINFYNIDMQNTTLALSGAGTLVDIVDSNVYSLTTDFSAPATVEFFDTTTIGGIIHGTNTNLIFYTAPTSNFGMRGVILEGDSFVNFTGVKLNGPVTEDTRMQIVLDTLKMTNDASASSINTITIDNVAMLINYLEQNTGSYGTAIISLNGYVEIQTLATPGASAVEVNNQGIFSVNNINAEKTLFSAYNLGQLRIDSVYLLKGGSFYLVHQSLAPAVIGSSTLSNGNSVNIYNAGKYSGWAFKSYIR